jgi:hypothetical protein
MGHKYWHAVVNFIINSAAMAVITAVCILIIVELLVQRAYLLLCYIIKGDD